MMSNEFKIRINTIENAKDFSNICEKFLFDVDVYYGRYIVDGRSLLGILSFDLMKPLNVKIHTEDEASIKNFSKRIERFITDDD